MAAQNRSLFWVLEAQVNHASSHLTGATLKDDVIANFTFKDMFKVSSKDTITTLLTKT